MTPAHGTPPSTLWFNAADQVIGVDSYFAEDDGSYPPFGYRFTYDAQGRLVESQSDLVTIRYVYTADLVTQTSPLGASVYTLAAGRAIHLVAPPNGNGKRPTMVDYTYDDAGRLASRSGDETLFDSAPGPSGTVAYTYDDQGRLTRLSASTSTSTETYAYAESADQLTVAVTGSLFFDQRLTYDFDADHRVIRSVLHRDGSDVRIYTYSYGDGAFDQFTSGEFSFQIHASGACPMPEVITSPGTPLPIPWKVDVGNFVSLFEESVLTVDR